MFIERQMIEITGPSGSISAWRGQKYLAGTYGREGS